MRQEAERLRATVEGVRDEYDTKLMKARKDADVYFTAYHDEAIPRCEQLYNEIIEFNAELGPIDTDEMPAEFYEPGFHPGWVPATMDALRVLRPLGWIPVYAKKMTFLQPMYKPFTEEDAATRLQARLQAREAKAAEERRSSKQALASGEWSTHASVTNNVHMKEMTSKQVADGAPQRAVTKAVAPSIVPTQVRKPGAASTKR
ncbi:hypothetical protein EK21DRAFT_116203 [Setomelanomma holmii]|uniref:Uncharacterized protein n=1 Tax=Setomelanomma holmii TaxID=210430 RepID=A0A9P4H0L9_9PLEO|nr:hypothetical protein EK21DRAFT_116203 [Setomelanomma holmii]